MQDNARNSAPLQNPSSGGNLERQFDDNGSLLPEPADNSPAAIVRRYGRVRSEQQWEVVRNLLHPMVMQNFPGARMAEEFNVSIDTIYRWKKRLIEEMRREAVNLQPRDFVMECVTSLRTARAEAWAGVAAAVDGKEKRANLQLVIQAETQFARLGERIGLYGRPGQEPLNATKYGETSDSQAEGAGGVTLLHQMMASLLSGEDLSLTSEKEEDGSEISDGLLHEIRPRTNPASLANIRVRKRTRK